MRRSSFALLMLLIIMGCAARQTEVQDEDQAVTFREVRKVTFQGNHQFSAGALRKAIASQPRPLFPLWKRGETYSELTLEEDLKRLQKYYFDRGFLNTQATIENVEEDAEKNTVEIVIAIEEGPPTLVAQIRVVGHVPEELLPEKRLMDTLALQEGARITKATFDLSQVQLNEMLQDLGYARARVVPRTEVDFDTHKAIVTVELQPGELTPLGAITISGEELVKERAIRRQLRIQTGDLYNPDKLKRTEDAIFGMGMFRSVTSQKTNLDAKGGPLEIDIKIQERKRRTIEIQGGFSTVAGPRFRAAWTHRKFFRGAEQLSLEAKGSFIGQEAKATLHFPYFLAQRTRFTQAFTARNDHLLSDTLGVIDPQPDFDLFSLILDSRIDRELGDYLTVGVGLDLSYNDFYNVNADAETEESTEDNLLMIQFAELTYNTSDDDFLNPTQGLLLRGRLEHSSTGFLSDVNFTKFEVEGRHYLPIWWRMILATRLLLGTIQPYGATDSAEIPRNVRFFAGGPGSVRGFRLNRLGPLDSDDDPVGGNSLVEGNAELRFPIIGQLWGALFLDFGNVFSEPFTYRFNDLRYAVGRGIRYITPIGPIRLDVGFVIDPRSNEDAARLEFSIGQAF